MKRVSVISGKRVVWKRCFLLQTPGERAKGLMFEAKVQAPLAIPFASTGRKRNALHSFFCPLFDAVFLDSSGRVVDIRVRVKPNQLLIIPRLPCKSVLEVAPGDSKKVHLGEKLVLKEAK